MCVTVGVLAAVCKAVRSEGVRCGGVAVPHLFKVVFLVPEWHVLHQEVGNDGQGGGVAEAQLMGGDEQVVLPLYAG